MGGTRAAVDGKNTKGIMFHPWRRKWEGLVVANIWEGNRMHLDKKTCVLNAKAFIKGSKIQLE